MGRWATLSSRPESASPGTPDNLSEIHRGTSQVTVTVKDLTIAVIGLSGLLLRFAAMRKRKAAPKDDHVIQSLLLIVVSCESLPGHPNPPT